MIPYRAILILWCLLHLAPIHAQTSDSERLGRGLDYFQAGKYHEALLLLQPLDRQYRLNPRYRAYIGVCYYYEWDYPHATLYLDSVIPRLQQFSPQELSFYYYADAESHFQLGHYDQALPLYERMLTLCHDSERPDAYYRMGFIYMYRRDWTGALDHFQSALVYYERHRPQEKARIAQLRAMIRGCCDQIDRHRIEQNTYSPADTTSSPERLPPPHQE